MYHSTIENASRPASVRGPGFGGGTALGLVRAAWPVMLALAIGLVAVCPAVAGPALKFENSEQEHAARPADELVTITYRFRNVSDEPVRLVAGETNCDCLKAEADKNVIGPGEEGELRALFALGEMLGRKRQRVTIITDEKDGRRRYNLFVIMDIPILVKIEPDVVRWTAGGPPEEQIFDVRMTGDEPMKITDISSTRPVFEWDMETIEEGRHYRLRVHPKSTEQPTMGALRIETDSPVPKYQRALAFLAIRPPEQD